MPPPPAEPLAPRLLLGPALRTQSDRRLVKLVREGYDVAFEEIVRRYRKPLDRFAAAFVGGRSEDVTQDAFSKALLALRGSEQEIELRPWLYRIVRNTALNDLRDQPDATAELGEEIGGGESAAVAAERREEIRDLMTRLRALPEPQRAAIVMRELEGLSHEEIAAALGLSGGGARQAIYRARTALRDGLGLLLPLPVLRMLFDHGAEAAGAAGAGGAIAAAGAATAGGGGAAAGGIGAAGALKVGVATALLAGSVGAGVAMEQQGRGGGERGPAAAEAAVLPGGGSGGAPGTSRSSSNGPGTSGPLNADDSDGGGERERGEDRRGEEREQGRKRGDEDGDDNHSGRGDGRGDDSAPSGLDDDSNRGSSGHGRGRGRSDEDSEESHSDSGRGSSGSGSGGSDSGRRGSSSGSGSSGSSGSGSGHSGNDSGDSSGHSDSGSDSADSGDDNQVPTVAAPPPPETPPEEPEGGSDSGGSDDHSGSGGSGGDDDS